MTSFYQKTILGCSLLLLFGNAVLATTYQVEKKLVSGKNHPLAFIDDLDNNSYSEAVFIEVGDSVDFWYRIRIEEYSSLMHIRSRPMWAELKDITAFDINGNGRKEILYAYQDEDSLYLNVFEPTPDGQTFLNEKIWFWNTIPGKNKWDGTFKIEDFADLNHDGFVDVLLRASGGYDLQPRGVIAYDLHNRKKLWHYFIGPSVGQAFIRDLNEDGAWEIYLRTGSPCNGVVHNGAEDCSSYLIVIDENGNKMFQQEMGKRSATEYEFAKFSTSGRHELITITFAANYQPLSNQIVKWRWNSRNQFVQEEKNDNVILGYGHTVLNYQGIPHLFITNARGQICILDSALRLVKYLDLPGILEFYKGAYDLNFDGKNEYLWSRKGGGAIVLNSEYEYISDFPDFYQINPIKQGRLKPVKYAMITYQGDIYEVSLQPVSFLQQLSGINLTGVSVFLLIINIVLLALLFLKFGSWTWYRNQLNKFDTSLSALIALTPRGKMIACNKAAEKLLEISIEDIKNIHFKAVFHDAFRGIGEWLEKNFQEKSDAERKFTVNLDSHQKVFQVSQEFIRSRFGFVEGVILIIDDITPVIQSRKTASWVTVSQKLAHEIKNPLSSIRLTLQRMKYELEEDSELAAKFDGLISGGLEDVSRLRRVVDDFMHFSKTDSANFTKFELTGLVREIRQRYELTLPDGLMMKLELAENLPRIEADATQINVLLTNLIDNAIEATHPPGEVLLKLSFIEKYAEAPQQFLEEMIELEISDTGEGMDEEKLQKIRQPFFTTKESGSGLGMTIVEKIVKDHNGRMEIFSKAGLGTKIVIQLPVTNILQVDHEQDHPSTDR